MCDTTALQPNVQVLLTGTDWVLVTNMYQSKFPLCHHSLDKSCSQGFTTGPKLQNTAYILPLMQDTRLLMRIQQARL